MVVIQARSRRKPSGGRYKSTLSKRTHMLGRNPTLTKIGEMRKAKIPSKGGHAKMRLYEGSSANLYDPKTKRHEKATITTVLESPADRNFVRRNILTRNTVVQTDKGKARITNRPGQEGAINAILLE
jgi:small subunit ribosomal protein S8e